MAGLRWIDVAFAEEDSKATRSSSTVSATSAGVSWFRVLRFCFLFFFNSKAGFARSRRFEVSDEGELSTNSPEPWKGEKPFGFEVSR